MGHKTDQRRYRESEPEQSGETPLLQISPRQAKSLATRCLKQLEAGRRAYGKAGELLDALVAGGMVGSEIKLSDGRTAAVVDQFANKNKAFKTTPFDRFKLDVV